MSILKFLSLGTPGSKLLPVRTRRPFSSSLLKGLYYSCDAIIIDILRFLNVDSCTQKRNTGVLKFPRFEERF